MATSFDELMDKKKKEEREITSSPAFKQRQAEKRKKELAEKAKKEKEKAKAELEKSVRERRLKNKELDRKIEIKSKEIKQTKDALQKKAIREKTLAAHKKTSLILNVAIKKLKDAKKGKIVKVSDMKKPEMRKGNRFTTPELFLIKDIVVKPEIFQGRTVPYAEETVKKIVNEGYDTSQEPIVLFKNEKGDNIVISGHSRFHAAQEIAKKDRSFIKIPVKFWKGDFDSAVDYAVIESNRSGKAEGIESDIKAYIRAADRGFNSNYLLGIFKSDSYIATLRDLSWLDPRGLFIHHLKEVSNKSFPYLLRNAEWVGYLKRMNPKADHEDKRKSKLTNSNEQELFDFFYTSLKGLKVRKEDLFARVNRRVKSPDFREGAKLNLQQTKVELKETSPGRVQYNEMGRFIEDLNHERLKKEELIAEAEVKDLSNKKELIDKFKKRIQDITKQIPEKIRERIELGDKIRKSDSTLKKESALF